MRGSFVVGFVLLLLGCGSASDCKEVCRSLMADCDWSAWESVEQCARGCDDELFRHPEREAVLDCYDEAAYLCDVDRLLPCRVLRDEFVGVDPDDPAE